jgi:hypothetical protein
VRDQGELQRECDQSENELDQFESELDQRELHLVDHLVVDQRERELHRKLKRDLERQREAADIRSALRSAAAEGGRGGAAAVAATATAAAAARAAAAATATAAAAARAIGVITAATTSQYLDAARRAHMAPPLSALPVVADPLLPHQVVPGYHPAATSATPTRAGVATTAGASAALVASDIGQRVGPSGEKFWFAALRGETAARELAPPPHDAAPMAIRQATPRVGLPAKSLPAKSLPAKSPPAKSALSAVAQGVSKPSLGAGIFARLQRPVLGGAAALCRAALLPGSMATKPFSRLALTEMLQESAPPPQGAPQAVGAPLLQAVGVPQAKGALPPPRALEMMPGLLSSESLELNHEAPPLQLPITRPVTQSPALPSTPGPESPYMQRDIYVISASPDNVSPLLLKPSAPRHALPLEPLRFAPAPERTDKIKCFWVGDADGAASLPRSKRCASCAPSAVGEGGSENGGGTGAEEASPRAVKRACR